MGSGKSDDAHAPTAAANLGTAATSAGTAATLPAAGGDPAQVAATGRYQLGAQIGRGGMGEVISARDEQIGRTVAIKRMREASPDAKTTARFLREAKIQGRLEHPAIPPVHELSRDAEGRPFFVMKQLAGVTLADVIGMTLVEDPPTLSMFSRQRLLRAFVDICLAIEFAHKQGVVHRDLKPANIMLGEFGEVYVLDWGIARILGTTDEPLPATDSDGADGSTVAGAMLGTPGYMSPEQLRGDLELDGRADVYALGCILFEILACQPLHARGKAGIEALLLGTVEARPSVRAPDRDVPPELDAACVKATASDRDERLMSARGLGDIVRNYVDGDRDLAMRKQLAERELAAAKLALDGGLLETLSASRQRTLKRGPRREEFDAYSAAMRAASRALALDPRSRGAAELVARLMIEPPVEVPPEVDEALSEIDNKLVAGQARLGFWGLIGYLIFFPVIWLAGVHQSWLVFGGAALVLATMIVVRAIAHKPTMPLVIASFLAQVALVGLYSRGLSPLLIAPGVALITAMIYAAHTWIPGWVIWVCCTAGLIVPLAAEGFGLLSPTTTVSGSQLVMSLDASQLDSTVAIVGLGAYCAVILSIATLLTRLQAHAQRRIQRTVQLQTWQLQQLVPVKAAG